MAQCPHCSSPKPNLTCDLCGTKVCKKCIERLDKEVLSYLSEVPELLKHENFCLQCYDKEVASEKERCDALMDKAKQVYFLTKNFRGNVRVFGRHTKRVSVDNCEDRRECIMRLAFYAAELDFNAIIDADIESNKIVMGKYQTARWKASALPARIDGEHLELASLRGF